MKKQNEKPGVNWRVIMKKALVFILTAVICGIAVVILVELHPESTNIDQKGNSVFLGPPVTIRVIEPQEHQALVYGLGEAKPLWQTTLKSQVTGRIEYISPLLRVGHTVSRGEVLIRLAKTQYELDLAEAKGRLARAIIALLKEENEATEAAQHWRASGLKGKPGSVLVLRKPQLGAARAEVEAARRAVIHARAQLSYTEIKAPFDCVVIKRGVNLGETLFTGDEVARVYGLDAVEVGVALDTAQMALLPPINHNIGATLTDPRQQQTWQAELVRASKHLERDSRLRTVFLRVRRPLEQNPPLLPGTFLRTELRGKKIPGLLCIPETALTKQGLVWFVDEHDRLQAHRLEPVFYGPGEVYLPQPKPGRTSWRVALSPNSSFTNGMAVQPLAEKPDQPLAEKAGN